MQEESEWVASEVSGNENVDTRAAGTREGTKTANVVAAVAAATARANVVIGEVVVDAVVHEKSSLGLVVVKLTALDTSELCTETETTEGVPLPHNATRVPLNVVPEATTTKFGVFCVPVHDSFILSLALNVNKDSLPNPFPRNAVFGFDEP